MTSRLARTLPATLLLGAFGTLGLAHCSSIPDVTYIEDASSPDAPSSNDGAPTEADGGRDSGQADGAPSCPAVPSSICCDQGIACVGCRNSKNSDCRECAQACKPTQICCRKGGTSICQPIDAQCPP